MKNSGASKFITSFIYILFGLALMVWPQRVESVICTILAVCVIILGIAKLIGYSVIKVESRIANDTNGFAVGISLVILYFPLAEGHDGNCSDSVHPWIYDYL